MKKGGVNMNSEKRILKSKGTFIDNVEFDCFVTLTFNNNDSNNHIDIEEKVKKTLRKIADEYNSFEFIFVPEKYNNSLHYHGLIKGLSEENVITLLSEVGLIRIQHFKEQNRVIKYMTRFLTGKSVEKLMFVS